MECLKSVSFSIMIHGSHTNHFKSTRGLRQGDPCCLNCSSYAQKDNHYLSERWKGKDYGMESESEVKDLQFPTFLQMIACSLPKQWGKL